MKLSKKEKVLSCILGMLVIGIIYYEGVYSVQSRKIEAKKIERDKIEDEYNRAITTINQMENRKSEKKILNSKSDDISSRFYPVINQEHIILELNKLLKDSGLTGQYKFNAIEVKNVESIDKKVVNLKKDSLSDIVNQYNQLENESTSISDNKTSTDEAVDKNSKQDANEQKNSENKSSIQQFKCELSFKGQYSQLSNFLNSLSEYNRKIVVTDINIAQKTLDNVTGTMNLEFYAVPKLNNDLEEYLNWELNNTYGKNIPFSAGSAGNINSDRSITSDFKISVNSDTSVLPTVIIGKSNDSLRNSYVYAESNKDENAEFILSQDGDNYYYKYKTANGSYPLDYKGKGKKFAPISENIVIDILSDSRVNSDDKSGLILKITNNTDKLLKININGDDSKNPRVTIDGDGSNISINKK
ncbi:MAG TPA: pilus assembly protein PilO [Clostridium sp.]|nr:pilus assembly protein PilO [Clostridium sp.]